MGSNAQYQALLAKVDDFWDRALTLQPGAFACGPGCASCCAPDLSVFPVEAAAISAQLAGLDPNLREQLALHASRKPGACVFLMEDRCVIYPARPLICRTHGLALRIEGRRDHCPLNYTHDEPAPNAVLDLDQINTLLVLVNRLYLQSTDLNVDLPRLSLRLLAQVR